MFLMILLLLLIWFVLVQTLGPLLWGYRFSPGGVTFTVFRIVPIWRLRPGSIRRVRIVDVRRGGVSDFFSYWPHVAAGNRLQFRFLVVYTRGIARRWALTPKDPELAVALMGFDVKSALQAKGAK